MSESVRDDSYQDIWQRFISGDKEEISNLYFKSFDVLLNFGLKYSSDRYLVEDSIQNLFIDVISGVDRLKSINNIKFFLLKALKNQILYQQRKIGRLVVMDEPQRAEFQITYSIETELTTRETEEIVRKFLDMVRENLTIKQKEALYLRFNCGFDYDEISELMGISIESARTMIYRTIKLIRKRFKENELSNHIFFILFILR